MVSVLWFLGDKVKFGRGTGACAGCVEPASATWDQGNLFPEGRPHGLVKIEDNHVFNPNLYLTAKYAYYGSGFSLEPQGGLDQQAGISPRLGQTFGSTRAARFLRPQNTFNLDLNYFRTALGGSNEFKVGLGYRRAQSSANTVWPGDMAVGLENSATDFRARLYREGFGENRVEYKSVYFGDTYARNRLTLNLGLRYDSQGGQALPSDAASNGAFPNLVPGISFAGYDAPFEWNDFSPRLGVTYALDDARKTIVRASVARYASQLYDALVGYANPSGSVGYVEYPWNDLNGDHLVQPNEVNTGAAPLSSGGGFNPAAPTAVTSPNRFDPDLKAPNDKELIVGLDRELFPNFGVSVSYTYRRHDDEIWEPRVGFTTADYAPGTPVTGTIPGGAAYNIPIFIPNAALAVANGNGRILSNQPGYYQTFNGLELAMNKRLSNKWMMRFAGSYNNHREFYEGQPLDYLGNPTRRDTEPLISGGQVAPRTAGSGAGDVFLNGRWSVNVNGMYQLPWNFESPATSSAARARPSPSSARSRSARTGRTASSCPRASTPSVSTTCGTWTFAWPRT